MTDGKAGVAYRLRFDPVHHLVHVEVTCSQAATQWLMAVWTPGSYMVREYARHVEGVRAADEVGPRRVRKVAKNRWSVEGGMKPGVTLFYSIYCHEMTVRNAWVEQDFALLNGAPIFMTTSENMALPHDVRIELPDNWKHVVTAMDPHPDGQPQHFRAANFDTLVDSPILCGNPALYEFETAGKRHVLACESEHGIWDGPRAMADWRQLVQQNIALWGGLPYERYVMMNVLTDGRGGLEHKNSAVLMASRWAAHSRQDYVDWLGLLSHEYFHAWNIKRLRPVELGPFDYERENPTRSLWIAEGCTAYYDDLLVHRAGLSTQREYLDRLSKAIEQLQNTVGRRVQTLGDASFDAWIKFYRRDENSDNTAISYYIKGSIVAFLLDARIRQGSVNSCSLDDVMRAAYGRFAGERGFTPEQFITLVNEVAGQDLGDWLGRAIDTTDELDYQPALDWYGLCFKRTEKDDKADGALSTKPGWLGINMRGEGGRLLISEVQRGGPAWAAGLNVDDEILAIDEFRVTAGKLNERLKQYPPGSKVTFLLARRERLLRLPVETGDEPVKTWQLAPLPQPTAEQQKNLVRWLGSLVRPS